MVSTWRWILAGNGIQWWLSHLLADRRYADYFAERFARTLVGVETGRVVLSGAPAEVLERYAADEGYDFVVVGPRGHGASKLVLGSVASRLSRGGVVPVIVGPQLEPDTTAVPPTVLDRLLT